MWPNVKAGKVLLGALLTLATSHHLMEAQTDKKYLPADDTSDTASAVAPSESKTKSSLFYYLVMSGKTQDQFRPLSQSERAESYAKGLFSPFLFVTAAGSAGITQWQDVPHSWGQGAEGFGHRFGNYFAKQTVTEDRSATEALMMP
jgi:hypothetical protein